MSGDSRASGIAAQEVSFRGYKTRIPGNAVCDENLSFRRTRFPLVRTQPLGAASWSLGSSVEAASCF